MSSSRDTPSGGGLTLKTGGRAGLKSRRQLRRKKRREFVQLHVCSDLLQRVQAVTASTPDIDYEKVEQIRLAMERGELRLDSERLARKLIDFESDLS